MKDTPTAAPRQPTPQPLGRPSAGITLVASSAAASEIAADWLRLAMLTPRDAEGTPTRDALSRNEVRQRARRMAKAERVLTAQEGTP